MTHNIAKPGPTNIEIVVRLYALMKKQLRAPVGGLRRGDSDSIYSISNPVNPALTVDPATFLYSRCEFYKKTFKSSVTAGLYQVSADVTGLIEE